MTWAARPARPRCRARMAATIPHALRTSFCAAFPVHNPRYHRLRRCWTAARHQGDRRLRAGRLYRRAAGRPRHLAHRAAAGRAATSGPDRRCAGHPIMAPHSRAMLAALKVGKNAMMASKEFTGLASDSRKVKPGYLFAALPGTQDRRRALSSKDAVARGAVAVLARPELARRGRGAGRALHRRRESARSRWRACAAAFFGAQPDIVAAVTGTKGKSSIVAFLREIWTALGKPAASLGTVGVVDAQRRNAADPHHARSGGDPSPAGGAEAGRHRSSRHRSLQPWPGPVPAGRRDDRGAAASPTSPATIWIITPTFEDYLAAKLRLFTEVVTDGGVAVVNADAEHADAFIAAAQDARPDADHRRRDGRDHQAGRRARATATPRR